MTHYTPYITPSCRQNRYHMITICIDNCRPMYDAVTLHVANHYLLETPKEFPLNNLTSSNRALPESAEILCRTLQNLIENNLVSLARQANRNVEANELALELLKLKRDVLYPKIFWAGIAQHYLRKHLKTLTNKSME